MFKARHLAAAALAFFLGMPDLQAGVLPVPGSYRIVDPATQETVALMTVTAIPRLPTLRNFTVTNTAGEVIYTGSIQDAPDASTWSATTDRRPGTARRGVITQDGSDPSRFVISQSIPTVMQRLLIAN